MLPVRQNRSIYTIHREWSYIGQRVRETYWVNDGLDMLSDREKDYFQNYLFTTIPPNMFEFFFFDGEEISNIFSDSAYNTYIKNAVLTLCGYDTFSLIKKFCDTYVGGESLGEAYSHLLQDLNTEETRLEKINSEILSEVLKGEGATCEIKEDGKLALERFSCAEKGEFDAILMDVQMPVLNGYDATRAIRALDSKEARQIPIIAMTANAFAEDEKEALQAGMNLHLSKPIDITLLKKVIQEVL